MANRFQVDGLYGLQQQETLKMIQFITQYSLRKQQYLNLNPLNQYTLDSVQFQQQMSALESLCELQFEHIQPNKFKNVIKVSEMSMSRRLNQSALKKQQKSTKLSNYLFENVQKQQDVKQKNENKNQLKLDQIMVKEKQISQLSKKVNIDEPIDKVNIDKPINNAQVIQKNQVQQQEDIQYPEYRDSGEIIRVPTIKEQEQQVQSSLHQQLHPQSHRKSSHLLTHKSFQQQSVILNTEFNSKNQQIEFYLKLEAIELKQEVAIKNLLQRFNFKKESPTLKLLKRLTWQSLKMPKQEFKIKRFNYANIIQ